LCGITVDDFCREPLAIHIPTPLCFLAGDFGQRLSGQRRWHHRRDQTKQGQGHTDGSHTPSNRRMVELSEY
jgi:hypothetical protein